MILSAFLRRIARSSSSLSGVSTPSTTPLRSLLPPSSPLPLYRFLQYNFVSGTPKGKARLKTQQALKKKSFTQKNKRGNSSEDPRTKTGRGGPPVAKTRPVILRLNARLRRREAEREKLGLVSKLRQRDMEITNLRTAAANLTSEGGLLKEGPTMMGVEGMSLVDLGFLDGKPVDFRLTVEDGRRLAKEYSRLLMRWDRERQEKEMGLLQLRKEAIDALPDNLKRAALMPIPKKNKKMASGDEEEEKKKTVAGKGKKKKNPQSGLTKKKGTSGGGKVQKKG